VADFTWLPEKPVEEFDEVIFTNASTGENQNQWNWYFNTGYTSNHENTTYLFKEAGNYPVAMVVKTEQGCSDTVVKNISIDQDFVM
jgi:PKD repeat protein